MALNNTDQEATASGSGILKSLTSSQKSRLQNFLNRALDTVCSKRQYIRIAGDDKPCEVVKNQFLKLNGGHIEYVLASFRENATKVRNIKQYLLASLYNAPLTMSNYFDTLVRHDMANGFT